jgi:hypothetical protein
MALSGCAPSAMTIAGFSVPAAAVTAASPPEPVGALSAPAVQTVAAYSVPVGAYSVPVGAYSVPAVHCVDVPAPGTASTVGVISVPHCVVFNTERVAVAEHSAPAAVPVADSSAPRCVEIATEKTSIRRC